MLLRRSKLHTSNLYNTEHRSLIQSFFLPYFDWVPGARLPYCSKLVFSQGPAIVILIVSWRPESHENKSRPQNTRVSIASSSQKLPKYKYAQECIFLTGVLSWLSPKYPPNAVQAWWSATKTSQTRGRIGSRLCSNLHWSWRGCLVWDGQLGGHGKFENGIPALISSSWWTRCGHFHCWVKL